VGRLVPFPNLEDDDMFRCLAFLLVALLVAGCGHDTEKGSNKDKDKPQPAVKK
jgi:hypothetical protein